MKKILTKTCLLIALTLVCTSCYQASSNGDDDLITTPVTNNPNVVPEGGGFGPPSGMPY